MKRISLALLLSLGTAHAVDDLKIMDVDLSKHCEEELQKKFPGLECENIPSTVLEKTDDEGNRWKLRFHFGFSRTDYFKTDLHINSSFGNVVVRDMEMHERTSAKHYDPRN
jgi:hypothetical protein